MDPFPPTEQQRAIIEHRGSNLLIFAGPGTGKTETLARRFASLVVDDRVGADQILVLTFSRRAADEMRDRVRLRLRQRSGTALAVPELFVKTFHSFCARLLEGDGRGAPHHLLTPVKERLLWRRAARADRIRLRSLQPEVLASAQFATDCLNVITQLKGRDVDPARLQQIAATDDRLQDLAALYAALDEARRELGLRDFRDLVVDAVHTLDDDASAAAHWLAGAGFRHILVDEFQDSDPIDLRLLEQLARLSANRPQFCFVGDVNQSIYRFRGASPENVRAAQQLFKCDLLPLQDNRRSAQAVLDVANADTTLDRASLTRAADSSKNGSVALVQPRTIDDEVRMVADAIAQRLDQGTAARDIAVLLRQTRPYRELIVAALHARGLPVAALPAAGFYEDALVDAVLTAVRLLAAPTDLALWRRLLVNPIVGYRAVDVSNAFDGVRGRNASPSEEDIFAALTRRPTQGPHPISWFLQSWKHCRESYRSGDPVSLLRRVISELDLLRPLREGEAVAGFDAVASPLRLQALLTAGQDYSDLGRLPQAPGDPALTMANFIERLDETVGLLADANEPPASVVDGIRVMSIHAAKGLEFDCVIIPQAIDGVLPADERPNRILTNRSIDALRRAGVDIFADGAGVRAEEHALWYVALTRARNDALISAAQFDDDGVEQLLSPFTARVPRATDRPVTAGVQLVVHAGGGNGEPPASGVQQPTLPGLVAPAGIALGLPSLSPSSINTFVTCPRRFFYSDVLRLPRSDDDDASVHGQLLHAILRRFHERYTDFSQVDDPTAAADEYGRALFALIDDELAAAMPHAEQSALAQFERHDLRVRLDMYAEQLADDASRHPFVVLGCEQSLTSRFNDVVVLGRADRIDRLVDGSLAIRDYKSGSNRAKKPLVETLARAFSQLDGGEDLFGDAPDGLNLQLLLYVRGAEQLYGADVRRLEYWYFRGDGGQKNELRVDATWLGSDGAEGLSRADIERVERDIAARIKGLCNDGRMFVFPTAKDERVCRYCDYVTLCPGVGAVTA